jgi:chaperonin GroES
MNLKPLGDRIVAEVLEEEQTTASGIVLPDTAQEKPQRAKVLAVGSGHYEFGHHVPLEVEVGDVVLFSKYGGTEIKDGGRDYLILRESDILAVLGAPAKAAKAKK